MLFFITATRQPKQKAKLLRNALSMIYFKLKNISVIYYIACYATIISW